MVLIASKHINSNVLYKFKCNICNSGYIGKTKRHLLVRQYEHLGLSVLTNKALKYTEKDANKAKDFYKNNKERLREKARDKYRSLSEEEKNKEKENTGRKGIIICLRKYVSI